MWTRCLVAAHLGTEELAARYRAARGPVERSRWQMIWLLVSGRPLGEVAAVTGYGTRWVREVVRRYKELGPEALADQRHRNTGAAPLLDAVSQAALEEALRAPPAEGGRWTGRKVAAWIARRTGRERVAPRRGWALPEAHRPQPAGAQTPAHQGGRRGGAGRLSENLSDIVDEERAREPGRAVEVWAVDEHRTGLQPVRRRVWAKTGQRPVATAHPRYEWLSLYGFVHPGSGAVEWFLCTTVNLAPFAAVLERFAASVGAGKNKRVILVLDGAGWHASQHPKLPKGLRRVFPPPSSPERQPAEHLWPLVDEAIANQNFASLADLDQALARRCLALTAQPNTIKATTTFHWWPKAA